MIDQESSGLICKKKRPQDKCLKKELVTFGITNPPLRKSTCPVKKGPCFPKKNPFFQALFFFGAKNMLVFRGFSEIAGSIDSPGVPIEFFFG